MLSGLSHEGWEHVCICICSVSVSPEKLLLIYHSVLKWHFKKYYLLTAIFKITFKKYYLLTGIVKQPSKKSDIETVENDV